MSSYQNIYKLIQTKSIFLFLILFTFNTSAEAQKNSNAKGDSKFVRTDFSKKIKNNKVIKLPVPSLNRSQVKALKSRSAGLISQKVYKQLSRGYDLASSKKYKQALKALKDYSKKSHLRKGERAEIFRNIGLIYAQEGNNIQAESYLRKALNTKYLPYHLHLSVLYNLAQLALSQEKYVKTKQILETWFAVNENPVTQGYILLAICYSEQKQVDKALVLVEKAIKLSSSPAESWLKFALLLYIKRENYKKSQSLLEQLVAQFPSRKEYWKQLLGVYLKLDQSKKALITLELASKMGYLKTQTEYLTLASLYINEEIPLKGAQILNQKIKEKLIQPKPEYLKLRAEAYWMARENKKAMTSFKEAILKAKDENIYIIYGNLLIQEERWKQAEDVFRKAKSFYKPELKEKKSYSFARVHLGLGMTLFHQNKYEEALIAFRKAFEFDSDLSSAFYWIQYTETALKEQKNT